MAFDIYGGRLRPGYCEVHPDVPETYPCSVCMAREAQPEPRRPEPEQPPCDICGENPAVAGRNGFGVCSEACGHEAAGRDPKQERTDG